MSPSAHTVFASGAAAFSAKRCIMRRSSAFDGVSTRHLNMKRSTWASGSGYVPSCSIGFCVASTRNGSGRRYVSSPIVTWRSCIDSRSADCTFAGARLISSASSMFVKTGPFFGVNSPVLGE